MGFWDLFVVALMPVLKLLIITGVGLLLALERVNLLGPNARHHLNDVSSPFSFHFLILVYPGPNLRHS